MSVKLKNHTLTKRPAKPGECAERGWFHSRHIISFAQHPDTSHIKRVGILSSQKKAGTHE
jgi:hypothetical protein